MALAAKLQMDALPDPLQSVNFSGIDFTLPFNRRISFHKFNFGDKANFNGAIFGSLEVPRQPLEEHASLLTIYRDAFKSSTYSPEGGAQFQESHFGNRASFEKTRFGRGANFSHCKFGEKLSFNAAYFDDSAFFEGSRFGKNSSLRGVLFIGVCFFGGAVFEDKISFTGSNFFGGAYFIGTKFGDRAQFDGASFARGADFRNASFGNSAQFRGTSFHLLAKFDEATFGHETTFEGMAPKELNSLFNSVANQYAQSDGLRENLPPREESDNRSITMPVITFIQARFDGVSSFANRKFEEPANFRGTRFNQPPEFAGSDGHGFLDLTGIDVHAHGALRLPIWSVTREWTWRDIVYFPIGWQRPRAPSDGWTTSSEMATRVRRFRQLASSIHAHDTERDLFILERRLERGYQWHHKGAFAALPAILMLFFYGILSNYGRSLLRPFLWLLAATAAFHAYTVDCYAALQGHTFDTAGLRWWEVVRDHYLANDQLNAFTLGNTIPFVGLYGTTRRSIVQSLFGPEMAVPWEIYLASTCQSIVSIVLIFLFLLAVRTLLRLKA